MESINRVTHVFGLGDWVENGKEIVNLKNGKEVECDPYFIDLQHCQ